jgi:3-isopropylmalate dehydrogenase
MKTLKFAVLPGDGIGPEVMEAALEVVHSALLGSEHRIDATYAAVGGAAIDQFGEALPEGTVKLCE